MENFLKKKLLVTACLEYIGRLEKKGYPIMATRTHSGKKLTRTGCDVQLCRKGYPEITMLLNGKFYGLECKTEHIQTPEQIAVQALILKAGGIYAVIRTVKDLKNIIDTELQSETALCESEIEKYQGRIIQAERLIARAVEIMEPEQVGLWEGVRAWLESDLKNIIDKELKSE